MKSYIQKNIYPFHMPGHKNNKDFMDSELLRFDLTELGELDNLHHAEGIILDAQKKAAKIFNSDESFFLVNGSTVGIISAIVSVLNENDELLLCRNSHKSAYTGLLLSGAGPVYVYPSLTELPNICGGIAPSDIEEALHNNKNIKAVFITSPTYEGFTSNISEISAMVHGHNKILIVDEAHGSHFAFHSRFPYSAVTAGADIVINSLHKTLPALNQSSILHVKGERVNRARLKNLLAMLQTSSPSYILMAQMDRCIGYLANDKYLFDGYITMLEDFRKSMSQTQYIKLVDEKIIGSHYIEDMDIGKLVFYLENTDLTPHILEKTLLETYKIQIEMRGVNHILAMTSVADRIEGFDALKKSLIEIDKSLKFAKDSDILVIDSNRRINDLRPKCILTPKQAFHLETERKLFWDCENKVIADSIIPYPPGIPILVPGELVSNEAVELVKLCIEKNIAVMGLDHGYCNVVRNLYF